MEGVQSNPFSALFLKGHTTLEHIFEKQICLGCPYPLTDLGSFRCSPEWAENIKIETSDVYINTSQKQQEKLELMGQVERKGLGRRLHSIAVD